MCWSDAGLFCDLSRGVCLSISASVRPTAPVRILLRHDSSLFVVLRLFCFHGNMPFPFVSLRLSTVAALQMHAFSVGSENFQQQLAAKPNVGFSLLLLQQQRASLAIRTPYICSSHSRVLFSFCLQQKRMPRTPAQKAKYNAARRARRAAAEAAKRAAAEVQLAAELRRAEQRRKWNQTQNDRKKQRANNMTPASQSTSTPAPNSGVRSTPNSNPPSPIGTTDAARVAGYVSIARVFLCFFCTAKYQQTTHFLLSSLLASYLAGPTARFYSRERWLRRHPRCRHHDRSGACGPHPTRDTAGRPRIS